MKTGILTIGTELLFGQILNTNTQFLSKALNDEGFDVLYHYTVGDNKERLQQLLKDILKECDIVITTGGLGPTQDDLTKEAIAEVMNDFLVVDENVLKDIESHFKARNRVMTENNKKQALLPSCGEVLKNTVGSAPGFILKKEEKVVIAMPGPPFEMENMYNISVKPFLRKYSSEKMYYKFVKTSGIGESELETRLMNIIDGQKDPTIATYVNDEGVYIRVASKGKTENEAKIAVENTIAEIEKKIGEYIFTTEDKTMYEVLVDMLEERGLSLSSAESCTGGMFAEKIISVAGASKVFDRGVVSYSNIAKMEELGVRGETLEIHGAVSSETAIEMVDGLYEKSKSDVCIAVTGIAGPSGKTLAKPVGLVYIAIRFKNKTICIKENFGDIGRSAIRNRSVRSMARMIYDILKEK